MGRMEALPADLHTDAVIGLMLSEAIKNSAIEGESLDRDSVRAAHPVAGGLELAGELAHGGDQQSGY